MPPNELPKKIKFHLIKSNLFRVVHADGAWGGLTPRGLLEVNFYSERTPIPREITLAINAEPPHIGGELMEERVTRDGILREVEVGVMMDLAAATSFRDWLDKHVKEMERISKEGE